MTGWRMTPEHRWARLTADLGAPMMKAYDGMARKGFACTEIGEGKTGDRGRLLHVRSGNWGMAGDWEVLALNMQ